jgi:Fatty acid hydroxylase superfamily
MSTTAEIRETAIARGRVLKTANALTAMLCGGLPAIALCLFSPPSLAKWLIGLVAGLLWGTWFEYAYHRFLLHLPGTFFAKEHLRHHMSVDTPTEAEHLNLGGSPLWVMALFAVNGLPVVAVDLLFKLGIAPGILVAFSVYFITTEEFHWRIHLGEWLPPGFRAARPYHLEHHMRPNARFNIFFPLWDVLLGSAALSKSVPRH